MPKFEYLNTSNLLISFIRPKMPKKAPVSKSIPSGRVRKAKGYRTYARKAVNPSVSASFSSAATSVVKFETKTQIDPGNEILKNQKLSKGEWDAMSFLRFICSFALCFICFSHLFWIFRTYFGFLFQKEETVASVGVVLSFKSFH